MLFKKASHGKKQEEGEMHPAASRAVDQPAAPSDVNQPAASRDVCHTTTRRRSSATYATKKAVAQSFLNISLISANAGQLRKVINNGEAEKFYTMLVVMIIISILLQVIVAFLLVLERFGYTAEQNTDGSVTQATGDQDEVKCYKVCKCYTDTLNSFATFLVILITTFNVIIPIFGSFD